MFFIDVFKTSCFKHTKPDLTTVKTHFCIIQGAEAQGTDNCQNDKANFKKVRAHY